MKVAILCGGKGTRMREITEDIPKPLAMIGNRPILWHIMKIYHHYGFNDFVLLLGYKSDLIKEYFVDYVWKSNSFILNRDGSTEMLQSPEKWKVTFLDTGEDTMTGGRINRAKEILGKECFMLTYGDGLANINLKRLLDFHRKKRCIATVTGIKKTNQYGVLAVENDIATDFTEKPPCNDIINGGFFVMNHQVFDYIADDDRCIFEKEPLVKLAKDQQLAVYRHDGFWTAMDTYKDVMDVNTLWNNGKAKWKVW